MPIKYSDYTLDDEPQCPKCNSNDIGIFVNEYYCLTCGFMFSSFVSHSKGHSAFSLNDYLGLKRKPIKIIDTELASDIHEVVVPMKDNVVSMVGRTRKVIPEPNHSHGQLSGILPDDYEECSACGYDHGYDYSAAVRWHQANPESGDCLTQDDLVLD